jgi:hypothetical protein
MLRVDLVELIDRDVARGSSNLSWSSSGHHDIFSVMPFTTKAAS